MLDRLALPALPVLRGEREGVRREAVLYPDGWKDLILMGLLRSEYAAQRGAPDSAVQRDVPDSAGSA